MPYASRVREFLEELAARAGGKIRLRVIDPQPFSEDEDRAAEFGLQSLQAGNGGDALYFGLAGTNSTDGRSAIPGFTPDREEFLEYDVAKLIQELGTPKKPVIGLMSSIGMQGQFNPQTGQMGEPWPILHPAAAAVHRAHPDPGRRPHRQGCRRADAGPSEAAAAEDLVCHRPIRDARRTACCCSSIPTAGADTSGQDPSQSHGRRDGQSFLGSCSRCSPPGAWATTRARSSAIWTAGSKCAPACARRPVRHIGILGLRHEDMDAKDVVTSSLESINLATAGFARAHGRARPQTSSRCCRARRMPDRCPRSASMP